MICIKNRCPWCGEIIKEPFFGLKSASSKCNHCKKWSHPYNTLVLVIFILLMMWGGIKFSDFNLPYYIELSIFSLVTYICVSYVFTMPLRRITYNDGTSSDDLVEPTIGKFDVIWNQSKFRTFKSWNNAILFMCFLNDTNVPLSNMICVRVKKHRNFYVVTKIDNRLDMSKINTLITEADRVKIFNEKKLIGEASIYNN